jgi:hypothetical protein
MSKQEIEWIDLKVNDKKTWPNVNIEKVLIETNWSKYYARLVENDLHGGFTFEANETPFRCVEMTTVKRWCRI